MPTWLRLAGRQRDVRRGRRDGSEGAPGAPESDVEIAMIRQDSGTGRPEQAHTSTSMVPSSHVGDVSLADSETPLVRLDRMASSTSASTVNKAGLDTPLSETSSIPLGTYTPATELDDDCVKAVPDAYQTSSPELSTSRVPKGSKARGQRSKLFSRPPVPTITSTMASGFRRKRSETDADSTQPPDSTNSIVSVKKVTSLASHTNDSSLDQELGLNGGKGNEGILCRVYDTWALTSLGVANIGPVAGAFFGVHTAKEYGGYGMLSVGWPISGLFMCMFSAVLAEMSSSYPVAGAMYTWTFRLCRLSPTLRPLARFLSWLCGSFLLCGHVLAQILLEWQMATIFQGLIVIFVPNYQPTTWRTVFFSWGGLLITGLLAVTRMGRSPVFWKTFSVIFIFTVVLIVASLFASTSERNSTAMIFTSYSNNTGFTQKGWVYLLGWVLTSVATGQDIAAHLAEESKYPTRTVPRAVFWCTVISYLAGWIIMLSIMAVSPETVDMHSGLRDYGAPAQILNEVLPRPVAFVIVLLLVILMQFQDVAQLLASSRFVWALARDSAIPFSPYLRRLSASRIPTRATWIICCAVGPVMLLVAASRKIVTSLVLQGCGASLVLAYLIPVLCYLTCQQDALNVDGRNDWTLRIWSKYIAMAGTAYIGLVIVLMCCPNDTPVTSTSFSFAGPVLVFVALLATLTWIFFGNSHYAGPIKSITVYTIGREVELPKSTHSHSTNRHTPNSAKPTTAMVDNGGAMTETEVGKTANLYSESLATFDLGNSSSQQRHIETWQNSVGTETDITDAGTISGTEGSYSDTDGSNSISGASEAEEDRGPVRQPRSAQEEPIRRHELARPPDLLTSPSRVSPI